MSKDVLDAESIFDRGHQGDFDYTQIALQLTMTPTERLDKHEGWRLFMKEALARAALRQRDHRPVGAGTG